MLQACSSSGLWQLVGILFVFCLMLLALLYHSQKSASDELALHMKFTLDADRAVMGLFAECMKLSEENARLKWEIERT